MGSIVNIEDITSDHKHFEQAIVAREQLIESLSNFDEQLGDLYLSEDV